jgi:hypothetical protein
VAALVALAAGLLQAGQLGEVVAYPHLHRRRRV